MIGHKLPYKTKSATVGVWSRGGPKPTSECCVSLFWMVMQGEHSGVYPGSDKRMPYVQRGREVCISLHRSACVGVTSLRERTSSPSLKEEKKEYKDDCLRCWSQSCVRFVVRCPLESPGLSFYRARGGQDDGEPWDDVLSIPVKVTVATALGMEGHPWTPRWRRGRDAEMTRSAVPCHTSFPVELCRASRLGRGRVETGWIRPNPRDCGIRALSYPPSRVTSDVQCAVRRVQWRFSPPITGWAVK
jgi:hypothetical protein